MGAMGDGETKKMIRRILRRVDDASPVASNLEPDPGRRQDLHDNRRLALLLAFTLRADDCCIDIGCHEGGFLRDVVRLAPNGKHLAFEPLPHLYAQVRQEFPDVDIRKVALSDREGEASFVHVKDLPGYSGFRQRTYPGNQQLETITVATARLDDILPEGFVPSFIKIDVEGAEELVLKGSRETLGRFRPTVIFEHGLGAADHYGTNSGTLWSLFHDSQMRIFDLDGNGPYSRDEFEDAFAQNERWNFVAH